MLRILMLKRGSAATLDNYRGAEGELVYDRTAGTLRIHDGIRTGGYTMQRNAVQMETPTIVSPSNGAVDVSRQITFTSTPYSGAGNHTASRWMIYLDAARTELLHDSGWSNNLTSFPYDAPSDTQLYVQVMYRVDNEVTTPWSSLIAVKTSAEWLTYFTVFSQTSHSTTYNRTTSYNGSRYTSYTVNYQKGTSHVTSYSSTHNVWKWDANGNMYLESSTTVQKSRTTSYVTQWYGSTSLLTGYSGSRSTTVSNLTYYETSHGTSVYTS